MAKYSVNIQTILDEITATTGHVSDDQAQDFLNVLDQANGIFVAGKGRSAFMVNAFAMRLNQLGKNAHVIGETTVPSIQKGDVLLIASGSGSTDHLRILAEKAKSYDAQVLLVTTKADSPIGQLADKVIELPAGTKYQAEGSQQPLGSLFEQSALIFLDALVMDIQEKAGISESTMQDNHANLE